MRTARLILCALIAAAAAPPLASQQPVPGTTLRGDSVIVRLVDVELRTAVMALAQYLDRPVVIGNLPATRISIETPSPIPRRNVPGVLREMLEAQNAELSLDSAGTVYRARAKEPPRPVIDPNVARQAAPQGGMQLFVIRLRHAKASEVAATVNALYGRASALGEIGERPTTLARDLMQQQVPPGISAPPGVATITSSRAAQLTGETTIVPDTRANSLLIRATQPDFELIQAAVNQLDVRPLQVLIEVLIAEVRRDRILDIGVEATLGPTKATIAGEVDTKVSAKLGGPTGLGDFAWRLMGINGFDVDATIRAAESRGDARIVNRPVLLAANNERAEINVGSQRPFVQVARVLPTDNTARDQVIQYRDVGTRLSIIPTISFEGYVMLQVVQEINAATAEQQFNAPIISTRSVETRLLVRDSQTIVLGGLRDMQGETVKSGVPILSRIPFLGALFGRQTRRRNETELLVFLTPRIVRDDKDADALTDPLRRRAGKVDP